MKSTDRFWIKDQAGHWLVGLGTRAAAWGGRKHAIQVTRAEIEARPSFKDYQKIPVVRRNPAGKEPFIYSITYDVVTPESAEQGDVADRGFEVEDEPASLRDVVSAFGKLSSIDSWEISPGFPGYRGKAPHGRLARLRAYDTGEDQDYRTGETTRRAIHIYGSDANIRRLAAVLRSKKLIPARTNPARRRPVRWARLDPVRLRQLQESAAARLPKGSLRRRLLLRNPRQRGPANVDATLLKLANTYQDITARIQAGTVHPSKSGRRLVRGRAYTLINRTYPSNADKIKVEWDRAAGIRYSGEEPLAFRNPRDRQLGVPERHQLRVAQQSLKMPAPMLGVMGGPTVAQAKAIMARLTGDRPPKRNPLLHVHEHEFRRIVRPQDFRLYVHSGWNRLKRVRPLDVAAVDLPTRHGKLHGFLHRGWQSRAEWCFSVAPGITLGKGPTPATALEHARDLANGIRGIDLLYQEAAHRLSQYDVGK